MSRWTRGPRPSCKSAGYDASAHRAQTFDPTWLDNDLVLAMDAKNLDDITDGRGADDRVRMFRSFDPLADPDDLDVPDPWYAGDESFVEVLGIVERTCQQILKDLQALALEGAADPREVLAAAPMSSALPGGRQSVPRVEPSKELP